MGWLWEALEELMEEGQDWIVVVLVGELSFPPHLPLHSSQTSRGARADADCSESGWGLVCRHGNRSQRGLDLYLHGMALVSQARTLYLWLVVEREVLLLGSRCDGGGYLSRVA